MRLANKTALITGGNSGIGLATARLLAAEGARSVSIRSNERTLTEAREVYGGHATARLDVADLAAIEPSASTLAERLGRLDVVFANAGIRGDTPVGNTPIALFEEIVRVNLTARCLHRAGGGTAPLGRRLGDPERLGPRGHWSTGIRGVRGKQGGRTRAHAKSRVGLAPRGIRVNQVTPSATRTPIWLRIAPAEKARH